jgi:hypothetical protein
MTRSANAIDPLLGLLRWLLPFTPPAINLRASLFNSFISMS